MSCGREWRCTHIHAQSRCNNFESHVHTIAWLLWTIDTRDSYVTRRFRVTSTTHFTVVKYTTLPFETFFSVVYENDFAVVYRYNFSAICRVDFVWRILQHSDEHYVMLFMLSIPMSKQEHHYAIFAFLALVLWMYIKQTCGRTDGHVMCS